MLPRPATADELKQCNKDLDEMELKKIPGLYADFLKKMNGFAWNGIEFYSTLRVTDPESNYTLMDLVSMNDDLTDQYEERGAYTYFFLGRADDDYYVYSTETKKYEILELSSFEMMEAFDTFEALFIDVVGGRASSVYALSKEESE
jgi:hypothetical protein